MAPAGSPKEGDSASSNPYAPTMDSRLRIRCPDCGSCSDVSESQELDDLICDSCGSQISLLSDETLSVGNANTIRIAHFELSDRLGGGAFGAVFRAKDTQLDRVVAIKLPHRSQLSAKEAEMFMREARTAAQLRHPNIVSVHEVGKHNEQVYLVADFIDGPTLSDWLTARHLSPREAAKLMGTIARAVHYAHEQGVIHRDLKPGNIMLDGEGVPHITDFGLAKREVGDVTMTVEGQVLGTPAYMSPEQARGGAHNADRRADIYALGVILFELMTGEKPFRGNHRMLLHQVLNDEAPSPRKFNSAVDRDLETICLKCLEKDPQNRFPTSDALADELDRFLSGHAILSRRISPLQRAWRWSKRNKAVAALLTAIALILIVASTVSSSLALVASRESIRADDRAKFAMRKEEEAVANAAEAAENAQLAEAQANLAKRQSTFLQSEMSLFQRRYKQAFVSNQMAADLGADWQVGFQTKRIVDWCLSTRRLLAAFPTNGAIQWAIFPDEQSIVFQTRIEGNGQGPTAFEVQVGSIEQNQVTLTRRTSEAWEHVHRVSSQSMVAIVDDQLRLIQLSDLLPSATYQLDGTVHTIACSDSGECVAIFYEEGTAVVLDGHTLKEKAVHRFGPSVDEGRFVFAMSPSGQTMAVRTDEQLFLWDIDSDRMVKQSANPHNLSFIGSERQLITLRVSQMVSTEFDIDVFEFDETDLMLRTLERVRLRNVMKHKTFPDYQFTNESQWNRRLFAMRSEKDYSVVSLGGEEPGSTYRPEDLLPTEETSGDFVAHYLQDSLVAVGSEDKLSVLQVRPQTDRSDSIQHGIALPTANYCASSTKDHVFALTGDQSLREMSFSDRGTRVWKLEKPTVDAGYMATPFTLASSNERQIAVQYQEDDNGGVTNSDFQRKLIGIYDLASTDNDETVPLRHLIHVEGVDLSRARLYRKLFFTPDSSQVIFVLLDPEKEVCTAFAYDVNSGEETRRITLGRYVQTSPSFDYLASYSDDESLGIEVYDSSTFERITDIPLSSPVIRCAFNFDSSTFWAGSKDNVLRQYSFPDGKLIAELESQAAPLVILQGDRNFIGYVPMTDDLGRVVLVEGDTGRIDETLYNSFWFGSTIFASPDETGVYFPTERSEASLFQSLPEQAAIDDLTKVRKRSETWVATSLQRERMLSESKELVTKLTELLGNNDLAQASDVLVQLINLGQKKSDAIEQLRQWQNQLVHLYARQFRWEEAWQTKLRYQLEVPPHVELGLLAQSGRIEEYERRRNEYLTSDFPGIGRGMIHTSLCTLLSSPLKPDEYDVIRELAKTIELSELEYERGTAAKAMYFIGEYQAWFDSMPEKYRQAKVQPHHLMDEYQREPNEAKRTRLEEFAGQLRDGLKRQQANGVLGPYWHDYVMDNAALREAVRVLSENR